MFPLKKGLLVMLAGVMLVAPVWTHADDDDDDDDDDDRRSSRHYSRMDYEPHYILYCPCAAPPMAAAETAPPAKPRARGPEAFPKETPAQKSSAKERQLELLERELADERRLFSEAAAAGAREDMERHRGNIAALRRELSSLYR